MDTFLSDLESLGNGSAQDSFDLAALQYFENLDQQQAAQADAPQPAQTSPTQEATDLPGDDLDALTLQLMADTTVEKADPSPRPTEHLQRPRPRRAQETPPLSTLATQAGRLFDILPTEDQLLAYTLLQKLAKAVRD